MWSAQFLFLRLFVDPLVSTDGASASNNTMAATSTTTDGTELWISVCNTLGSACNNPQNGTYVCVCTCVCVVCVCMWCLCFYLWVCAYICVCISMCTCIHTYIYHYNKMNKDKIFCASSTHMCIYTELIL